MYWIFYFLAGIIQDFLFTLSLRFVNKDKAVLASLTAISETFMLVVVLYSILNNLDQSHSFIAGTIYAIGIGVGTFIAMKIKFK